MITYFSGSPTPKVEVWASRYSIPTLPRRRVPWQPEDLKLEPSKKIEHQPRTMVLRGTLPDLLVNCRSEEDKMMASDNKGWLLTEDRGLWTAAINFYSFLGI